MKKTVVILVFLSIIFGEVKGQQYPALPVTDSSLLDKGFEFLIGAGAYFGNKYNASYYNGSPVNTNNINYVLGNKYWYDEIYKIIVDKHPYVTDSVYLDQLPEDMKYSVSLSIALGLRYKLNKNWAISLTYSFTRLSATDVFTLKYNAPPGNMRNNYFPQHLIAKENRSVFDLAVSYLFHPHHMIKPYLELGVQFNFVDVKKFFALIEEERQFTLLDYYNGANYIPGVDMQKYNTKFGGPGYGFSLAAGLKIVFNKYISIDPVFYVSASSINLKPYTDLAFNYGGYLRIVMSDHIFGK